VTSSTWHQPREHAIVTLARNVTTRYVLVIVNVLIGLIMLRFNVQHLGKDTYGLWMLATSLTSYFTVLDFGYGSAVIRYVAEFKARRDVRSLNEVLSTMSYVFSAVGVGCYALAIAVAILLPWIFNLEPDQIRTGRLVILMTGLQVALFFPFSIYGGVINAFERFYVNNVVGLVFNVVTALVNVLVLTLGYGLVELVACTTVLRILPFWIYRWNAYQVFPALELRRQHVRLARLRELSGFSFSVAVVDWATRLTYATDAFFLGVLMNTAAVGLFAVAQRISDTLLTLTHQIHTFMMPKVVHRAIDGGTAPQRDLMIRATRFQLAIAMCLCGGIATVADTLIRAWLGPGWDASIRVTQILAASVVMRAVIAMPTTMLQGTGDHRFVSVASAWSAALNLVLTVVFIHFWGITGTAIATFTASALCVVLIFPRSCRAVGLSWQAGVGATVVPAFWPAVVAIACMITLQQSLPAGLLPVLGNLVVGGVVYAAVFFLFGLDRDERLWLVGLCHRVFNRQAPVRAVSDVVGSR
jgi:O-antigen/teichoic acid export membrane protein